MNNIKLGANLTLIDSKVNLGDIFMIEFNGEKHWYSPHMMISRDTYDNTLVSLEDGCLFNGENFFGLTKEEVCNVVSSEGIYNCAFVGNCIITIERA